MIKQTKTQAFLDVLKTGDTKAIFDYIESDPEYKARIAAGETPKQAEPCSMTREEKEKAVIELLDKLFAKAEHEKLRGILHEQPIKDDYFIESLPNFVRREKQSKDFNETLLYLDIFNYGYICGKRAERAKKKAAASRKLTKAEQMQHLFDLWADLGLIQCTDNEAEQEGQQL